MPTPEEWLATFDATVADVRAKAEAFERELEQAAATATAPDGSLAVTVAPNGSLAALHVVTEGTAVTERAVPPRRGDRCHEGHPRDIPHATKGTFETFNAPKGTFGTCLRRVATLAGTGVR